MRLSWIIRVDPKYNDGCPYKERHRHRRNKPSEDKAEIRGMRQQAKDTRVPSSWKRQEGCSPRACGGSPAPPTPSFWSSGLWNWERMTFCGFKPSSLGCFVAAAPGHSHTEEGFCVRHAGEGEAQGGLGLQPGFSGGRGILECGDTFGCHDDWHQLSKAAMSPALQCGGQTCSPRDGPLSCVTANVLPHIQAHSECSEPGDPPSPPRTDPEYSLHDFKEHRSFPECNHHAHQKEAVLFLSPRLQRAAHHFRKSRALKAQKTPVSARVGIMFLVMPQGRGGGCL